MKKGNFADACPKLEASQAREARSGTLLNLASCREHEGKTATAWALYKDAATLARTEKRPVNEAKAVELAAAVERRLSRVRVAPAASAPSEVVAVDGRPLDAASVGVAVPVDPGQHVVSASAPGYVPWSAQIVVGEGTQSVSVPALAKATVAPPPAAPEQGGAAPSQADPDSARPSRQVPTWAWITGGAGVALTAAAVVFRVDQSLTSSRLDENCGEGRQDCQDGYDYAADYSREKRDFALFVGLGAAGLVGLGVAAYGIITAPRGALPEARSAASFSPVFSLGPSSAHAGIRGAF
jgi:hypothetical protein